MHAAAAGVRAPVALGAGEARVQAPEELLAALLVESADARAHDAVGSARQRVQHLRRTHAGEWSPRTVSEILLRCMLVAFESAATCWQYPDVVTSKVLPSVSICASGTLMVSNEKQCAAYRDTIAVELQLLAAAQLEKRRESGLRRRFAVPAAEGVSTRCTALSTSLFEGKKMGTCSF